MAKLSLSQRVKILMITLTMKEHKLKIKAIRLKCHRDRMKLVAQRRFLHRRASKKICGIRANYPDIGKVIETYVGERSIGADACRRTGVLTFDGNNTVNDILQNPKTP